MTQPKLDPDERMILNLLYGYPNGVTSCLLSHLNPSNLSPHQVAATMKRLQKMGYVTRLTLSHKITGTFNGWKITEKGLKI